MAREFAPLGIHVAQVVIDGDFAARNLPALVAAKGKDGFLTRMRSRMSTSRCISSRAAPGRMSWISALPKKISDCNFQNDVMI